MASRAKKFGLLSVLFMSGIAAVVAAYNSDKIKETIEKGKEKINLK